MPLLGGIVERRLPIQVPENAEFGNVKRLNRMTDFCYSVGHVIKYPFNSPSHPL
jgi:hypothetical protein